VTIGQPVFRVTSFQLPEGRSNRVAIGLQSVLRASTVPQHEDYEAGQIEAAAPAKGRLRKQLIYEVIVSISGGKEWSR
jgi:hypothetical protein